MVFFLRFIMELGNQNNRIYSFSLYCYIFESLSEYHIIFIENVKTNRFNLLLINKTMHKRL